MRKLRAEAEAQKLAYAMQSKGLAQQQSAGIGGMLAGNQQAQLAYQDQQFNQGNMVLGQCISNNSAQIQASYTNVAQALIGAVGKAK